MSQPDIIKKYLESVGDWVPGNHLANLTTEWGWLPERACRTARIMFGRGEIERKEDFKNGKKIVFYRAKLPINFKEYWADGKLICRQPIYES